MTGQTDGSGYFPLLGIGSYAYRYAIGTQNFTPSHSMTEIEFFTEAHKLGLDGVQLCENLAYADYPFSEYRALKIVAQKLGLFIELGMRNLTEQNLQRHLEIAELLSSRFIRIVLGENSNYREENPERLIQQARSILKNALPDLQSSGMTLGIENHFDVPTDDLVRLVQEIDDEHVGLIFDTTNCLGFIQTPEDALAMIGPYLVSVHLKDYIVHKVEAGYLIRGAILGEGWLPLGEILESVRTYNPTASIILEMTTRRDPDQTVEATLAWEREAIEQSVRTLRRLLQSRTRTP